MTERTLSYRPGGWLGIVGVNATVLLPGTEKARAGALWPLVDDGAGFDAVLDALVAGGLSSLPGFVLLADSGDSVRVLVRGGATATFDTAEGPVVVSADPGSMWSERTLAASAYAISLPDEPADGTPLAVSEGLVRLGALRTPSRGSRLASVVQLAPLADPAGSAELPAADVDFLADEPAVIPAPPTTPPPPVPPVAAPLGLAPDASSDDDLADLVDESDPSDEEEAGDDEADELDDLAEDDELLESEQGDFGDAPTEVHDALFGEYVDDEASASGEADALSSSDPADADVSDTDLEGDEDAATDDIPVIDDVDPLGAPPSWTPDVPPLPPVPAGPPTGLPVTPPSLPAPPAGPPSTPPAAVVDEEPTEALAPMTPAAPAPHLSFSSGAEVDVDGLVVIGRRPDAGRFPPEDQPLLVAVPSPHSEISSTHLEVRPGTGDRAGRAVVTDLGSTNGTLVVQPGHKPEELRAGVPVTLESGALIDLGDGLTIRVR